MKSLAVGMEIAPGISENVIPLSSRSRISREKKTPSPATMTSMYRGTGCPGGRLEFDLGTEFHHAVCGEAEINGGTPGHSQHH